MERLDRKLIHHGKIIDYYQDSILIDNGNTATFDFIDHKGAAAVIPVRDDGRILMVKQYRPALNRETLEIPAGGKDGIEEPTAVCAARELEEETGYKSDNLELLLSIYTTVAFCNEKIDIYVARNLIPSSQNLDEDEFIELESYSVDELCQKVYSCEIQDAKTVAAIMAYKNKFAK